MARQSVNWEDMFRALEAFKKEHGHCHVPANWKLNLQLGRWVAMQRYRHKMGELPKSHVTRLDQAGFVWAPADKVWSEMLQRLLKYKKKHGDCDVPSSWPADPNLANWVANQRHRKKMGSLSPDRVKKLSEIGFVWSVYGKNRAEKVTQAKRKTVAESVKPVEPECEERLYQVCGEYVQFNGTGPLPQKLEKYLQMHDGVMPPCIILPASPLVFRMGNPDSVTTIMRKITWSGRGPLPDDVLEYLNENGALPPHGM
jgi:hypothetical protein